MSIALTLFFILVPAGLITLGTKFALIDKLGLVLICFAAGIGLNSLASLFGCTLFSEGSGLVAIQTQLTEISIALAIPLLVMSIDLRAAVRLSGTTFKALIAAFVSVLVCTFVLSFLFRGEIHQLAQVAGLAVGAYTGGGPNMAAINSALDGDQALFVKMTAYDILLSALYLLFAISVAKPLFRHLLPAFDNSALHSPSSEAQFAHLSDERSTSYRALCQKHHAMEVVKSIAAALAAVASSLALASTLPEQMRSVATIVFITSFGMLLSFIPGVRAMQLSFRLGMYLVLVFCFTMGSMTNLSVLADLDLHLFSYIGAMLIGAMTLHALLCRWMRIDVDTFLVTASASIMSVPFIPVIVGALRNPALLVPGFCAAILGYVLGNYLGISTALVLQSMGM